MGYGKGNGWYGLGSMGRRSVDGWFFYQVYFSSCECVSMYSYYYVFRTNKQISIKQQTTSNNNIEKTRLCKERICVVVVIVRMTTVGLPQQEQLST